VSVGGGDDGGRSRRVGPTTTSSKGRRAAAVRLGSWQLEISRNQAVDQGIYALSISCRSLEEQVGWPGPARRRRRPSAGPSATLAPRPAKRRGGDDARARAACKIHLAPSASAVTHCVGDLAQLVERMLSMYKVTRSIRVVSSIRNTLLFAPRARFSAKGTPCLRLSLPQPIPTLPRQICPSCCPSAVLVRP
jgi:hypothetical protein